MTDSRTPPRPTLAQIERAWRGLPIVGPEEDEGPPPPVLSPVARRNNWLLAALAVGLCVFAGVGGALSIPAQFVIGLVGAALLMLAMIGLRTQRMLGIAFRGRFIARREREPALYWLSLALIGFIGVFLCVGALLLAYDN